MFAALEDIDDDVDINTTWKVLERISKFSQGELLWIEAA
jgi:hypothetical protein